MRQRFISLTLLALLTAGLAVAVAGTAFADITPDQQTAVLAAHNTLRQNVAAAETQRLGRTVSIPVLTWNSTAAAVAQNYANQLLAAGADQTPASTTVTL